MFGWSMSSAFPFLFVTMQNVRPSADGLPEELALLLSSCWREDPNSRPNFSQIVQMLLHYLSTLSPPEPVAPARVFSSENVVLPPESPGTSSLMAVRDDLGDTPKSELENKSRGLFSCFHHCYWLFFTRDMRERERERFCRGQKERYMGYALSTF